jgi:protein phosphatase
MGDSILEDKSYRGEDLQVYACTDRGQVRPHNEDYFGYYVPSDTYVKNQLGSLFIVADGVGGSKAGEVASAEAVNTLLQEYYFGSYSERLPGRLKDAFDRTAIHVFDLAQVNQMYSNMQCTLSSLLLLKNKFYIAHVGDSKVFLVRSGKIHQLTKDHSLVGKLVRLGFVSPEAARSHPNKHVLLKAVGGHPIMPADLYSGNVLPGDLFCLVTDGIMEHATDEEMKLHMLDKGNSSLVLREFIDILNDRGGHDNMTMLTVKICG